MTKPNGLELDIIVISIDDGWVEYSYNIKPKESLSIDAIRRRICKALGAKTTEGVIRTSHVGSVPAHKRKGFWSYLRGFFCLESHR